MKKRFLILATLTALAAVTLTGLLKLTRQPAATMAGEFKETEAIASDSEMSPPPTSAMTVRARPSNRYVRLAAEVEAETDSDQRAEKVEAVAAAITDAELPAAVAALAQSDSPAASELRDQLVRRWAELDPAAAIAWAVALPPGTARTDALEQAVLAGAETDLPGTVETVNTITDETIRESTSLTLAYEAARTDPITALQLAAPLPASRERDNLLVHALRQWTDNDATAAATWIASIPDPTLQQRLLAAYVVVFSQQDAVAAAVLASSSLEAGANQNRAVVGIVQQWAQTNPALAASWVEQFPAGTLRDTATQNLLSIWTTHDAAAAGKWVEQLPAGGSRDTALAAYQTALAQSAIIAAAQQATNMTSDLSSSFAAQ
jgi:hypothetical protein